jgi:hypothetical protein
MKVSKSLAPINGLLILQEPMRIENELSYLIEFKMRILGPNETQELFHPPIK